MAIRFGDGFSHYSTAQIARKWTGNSGGSVATTNQRFSGSSSFITTDRTNYVQKTVPAGATYTVGFAFRYSSYDTNGSGALIAFIDDSSDQVCLKVNNPSLTVSAFRNTPNGTLLGTSAGAAVTLNAWVYLEVQVVIHPSAGTVVVRLNGNSTPILNLSGLNTRQSSISSLNMVSFFKCAGTNGGPIGNLTDVYMSDDSTFLGNMRVELLMPNGAGTTAQFTPSAGSNYQNVDENPATDGTGYNESSTLNQIDTFAFPALASVPASIAAVLANHTHTKTDAGTRAMKTCVRSGGANYTPGSDIYLGDSYMIDQTVMVVDPDTSAAWATSFPTSKEIGYKLTV